MLYPGGFQGTLEVIRAPHFQNFSFKREHPYRHLGRCKLCRVEAGDTNNCYAREPRNDLLEQPNLFPA